MIDSFFARFIKVDILPFAPSMLDMRITELETTMFQNLYPMTMGGCAGSSEPTLVKMPH